MLEFTSVSHIILLKEVSSWPILWEKGEHICLLLKNVIVNYIQGEHAWKGAVYLIFGISSCSFFHCLLLPAEPSHLDYFQVLLPECDLDSVGLLLSVLSYSLSLVRVCVCVCEMLTQTLWSARKWGDCHCNVVLGGSRLCWVQCLLVQKGNCSDQAAVWQCLFASPYNCSVSTR